ncbi:MAG: hypothetical protein D6B27_04285, partial [Gammaproteobacteria bacterium]
NLADCCFRASEIKDSKFENCILNNCDFRKTAITEAQFINNETIDVLYYGKAPWDGKSNHKNWEEILHTFDGE